ncbi:MAG: BLUF domain-containing protein [Chthoniobacter sp.]
MMTSALHSLVYVSTAVRPFSPEDLAALLAQSRERNQQAGITGMLLYKSGCFLQAFEGGTVEVRRLQLRIAADPRHRNVTILQNGPIEVRDFSDWTMGFKHLSDADVQKQPGFSEMLKMMLRHGRCSMDKSVAINLLRSFVEQPA